MNVRVAQPADRLAWDGYVKTHEDSTHCHLFGWKQIIEETYGHRAVYLIAEDKGQVVGLLPLIHMKSLLFGNRFVSMPFLNYGGPLGDSEDIIGRLIQEASRLAKHLRATTIEFRRLEHAHTVGPELKIGNDKIRMVLALPESAEALFKSFKAKLRSQIRKPQKAGCHAVIGGTELLSDFYSVFAVNMRDLGSPVHSRKLFQLILTIFADDAKVGVVFHKSLPVAGGIVIRYKKGLEIPWASSLRQSKGLASNMLLYWTFLEYACQTNCGSFDFGRSTRGEGTFKFKEQWGARPQELNWTAIHTAGKTQAMVANQDRFRSFAKVWRNVPAPIANLIGPLIRGSISL